MSKFEIRDRFTGAVIYEGEAGSFSALVQAAVRARAYLYGADLSDAYLSVANLSGANLSVADLSGAYLSGAYLSHAYLSGANLTGAYLSHANLSHAKLSDADLSGAYLSGANLSHAKLSGANMTGAYLYGADMSGANMTGTSNADLLFAQLSIVPEHVPFFAWKKCRDKVLVRLFIPSKAKRSNATGRKCRAERAKVLEVIGAEVGVSLHDKNFTYKVGQWVRADKWDDNRWNECSSGIHFFLTRVEAENYE